MQKTIYTRNQEALTERLRGLRQKAGLTQRGLAKKLGTAQTTVARVEKGQRRLDIIEFYWYCRALKAEPVKIAADVFRECKQLDKSPRR